MNAFGPAGRLFVIALAVAGLLLFATCGGPQPVVEAPPNPTPIPTASSPEPVPTETPAAIPTPTPPKLAEPAAASVESNDGLVTLEIPAGALPPGVSAADLSVSRLSPEETRVTFEGEQPIATYALRPDGLRFAEPVRLTVTIPDAQNVAPALVQVVGEELEIVPVLEYRLDGESGEGTVLAEIDHFSGLVIGPDGLFGIEFVEIPDQPLNVPFNVTAYTRNISEVRYQIVAGLLRYGTYLDGSWSVAGNFTASERLYPRRIDDAPPMTTIDGFSNPAEREFTCEETGSVHIIYHAEIRWRMVLTVQTLTDAVENREELTFKEVDQVVHLFVSEYFECLPPPTPTPTDTPTATPTATVTPRPPEGFIDVEVLHFVGARYPLEQLRLAEADACPAKHYHAGVRVFSLEGGDVLDPAPLNCGFGREDEVTITVDRIEMAVWDDYRIRLAGPDD